MKPNVVDSPDNRAFSLTVEEITVAVTRKAIKNIHLRLKPPDGKVIVSAPWHMKKSAIEDFVRRNLDWVRSHLPKMREHTQKVPKQYATGESLYLWGKPYRLRLVNTIGSRHLIFRNGEAILCIKAHSTATEREKYILEYYREILKEKIPPILDKLERRTGLHAAEWRTKTMKTRWGTCNIKEKRLWFNVQLAEKPPICLEYVVLHELMHLIERYHNAHFASLMDSYMPRWRDVKRLLNEAQPQ